ncbi:MAG: hypothetical protein NTV98_04685 [Candidatus Roizmanbacteria bacterium]|nr:hypothetical protein [Candidatus Roizmanbacteria bacterium]
MILDIPIDLEKKLAIKIGDKVDFDTPLYTTKEKSEERIEVAELLSIHPKKIFHHLKKNVGDTIITGDLLAEKKSFFSDKKVTSHIEGIITEIDHIEGIVLIETQKETHSEHCWFAGHVVDVSKKLVQIKIGKHTEIEAKYVEKDFGGSIWLVSEQSQTSPQYPVGITERATEYDVAKLEALGGRGLITCYKFEGATTLPKAEFKLKNSFEQVQSGEFSCCFAQAHHSTIILYSL